ASIKCDYERLFKHHSKFKSILKSLISPSLHAVVFIRLAQYGPSAMFWLWRYILIFVYSIDVGKGLSIGPGLILPHPVSIVFGGGIKLGANATIYQGVTLGSKRHMYPVIGDNTVIFTNSVVVGDIKVGDNVKIGALQFVDYSVESKQVLAGK
ncbi:hypothetical protein L1D29_19595, partial [Shewanella insulae]|uniref:serine O-acetyltransferase n=1 Tax=Shewanella insulae TaxID=2681496 RepID=UPI001EFC748A